VAGARRRGVRRQYTGTAGRIENAQVAVFLADTFAKGRALVDREVYLLEVWTEDPDRCRAAGVPDDVGFTTKVALGRRMLIRALDAGVPARFATADEFYGGDRGLRRDLQGRCSYAAASATAIGPTPLLDTRPGHPHQARARSRRLLVRGGMPPGRQERGRPRPAPGLQVDLLVPLHDPGHARPRVARGHRRS
jgi:SRSO17 transposase